MVLVTAGNPVSAGAATGETACKSVAGFKIAPSLAGKGRLVSNAAELRQALSSAKGGEVLLLAPGDYGVLVLGTRYRAPVTLRSASAGQRACISEMKLIGGGNLVFDELVFNYRFAGEPTGYRPFIVENAKSVTFSNSLFVGDIARGVSGPRAGFATGKGLAIRDSTGIELRGNEFRTWWKGLLLTNTTGAVVRDNEVHDMRSDGMNFVDVHSVVIENNYIHDFRRSFGSGDHGDMIQFWKSTKRPASSDVIIRGNRIDVGSGDYAQNLFMGNGKDKRQDPKWHYRNILIENNTIIGNHTHGITVNASNGLTIRNNSLVYKFAGNSGKASRPRIRVTPSSRNVSIIGNSAHGLVGYKGQADWKVSGNTIRP